MPLNVDWIQGRPTFSETDLAAVWKAEMLCRWVIAWPSCAHNGGDAGRRRRQWALDRRAGRRAGRRAFGGPFGPQARHRLGRRTGSGPAGRILIDDLTSQSPGSGRQTREEGAVRSRFRQCPAAGASLARPAPQDRRAPAGHATRRIPHYSYIDECDITEMVKLRTSLRDPCASRGLKLTYLSFFIKAAALALKEIPIVNSSSGREHAGNRSARSLPHRHRGGDAGRPGCSGRPRRGQEGHLHHRRRGRSLGTTPRRATSSSTTSRRDFHRHLDRQHRRPDFDPDHQSSRKSASWASAKS